jgi:hypothetical protein
VIQDSIPLSGKQRIRSSTISSRKKEKKLFPGATNSNFDRVDSLNDREPIFEHRENSIKCENLPKVEDYKDQPNTLHIPQKIIKEVDSRENSKPPSSRQSQINIDLPIKKPSKFKIPVKVIKK